MATLYKVMDSKFDEIEETGSVYTAKYKGKSEKHILFSNVLIIIIRHQIISFE